MRNDGTAKPRKSKKKRILVVVLCCVAAVLFVIMPLLTRAIYEANFGHRYETATHMRFEVSDFPGLEMQECSFPSNNGQMLAGYMYSKGGEPQGVIVMAHGIGGGHNTYMDLANYFASNGFLVFAYDATGNDRSEGNSMAGIPQGVIDLDYAIQYVKESDAYRGLPIGLFGHSWGGYSVGAVLAAHPDVKAAVIVAGFDTSLEMFELEGSREAGSAIEMFMPYVALIEQIRFGKDATASVMNGFESSNAAIMVIGSDADEMVSGEIGIDKFEEAYGGDSRFEFIRYPDRGHNDIVNTLEAQAYKEQVRKDYQDYLTSTRAEDTPETKAAFYAQHVDESRYNELDTELMDQIVQFYKDNLR